MSKNAESYHTTVFILHASKVMFKILQARLQQYMTRELPDIYDFIYIYIYIYIYKAEEPEM